jgi:N-acetylmuramoyl-L-alanine amidase
MSKVYIAAGHGGSDCGASANGYLEKDLNWSVAFYCAEALRLTGIDVKINRTGDVDSGISAKVKECNEWGADLAVDIHHNAGGGTGAEAYCSINGGVGRTLAENILAEIAELGQESRGVKTKRGINGDYFGFIRETKSPAVLVECAFIDTDDVEIVNTEDKRRSMGEVIAKGICKTLGVEYKIAGVPEVVSNHIIVRDWQRAAIADGYSFPRFGADGVWGNESLGVAKRALVRKTSPYTNKNLTKLVQSFLGVTADGLCGDKTTAAIKAWQGANGLTADGVIGVNSWKKLLNL